MKFKVGDRVRVYGNAYMSDGKVCVVYDFATSGELKVSREDDGGKDTVHPKQCRRLLPKSSKRSIWIKTSGALSVLHGQLCQKVEIIYPPTEPGWIEFVEKRKGK